MSIWPARLSEDPDFVAACKGCSHLEQLPSIAHFLDLWNAHLDAVKKVRSTLRENVTTIHSILDRVIGGVSGEMDAPGLVKISHRKIVDVLNELVISCDEAKASVEFICWVEFDAWLEIRPPHDAPIEYRNAEEQQTITVTLEFRFDPTNPNFFELDAYWAPQSITFAAHRAY